jgi:hypothetical protein
MRLSRPTKRPGTTMSPRPRIEKGYWPGAVAA